MQIETFLTIATLVLFSFVIAIACFRLIKEKILFNHKLLGLAAKKFYNYYYSIKKISHLRVNNFGYAPIDEDVACYNPDLQYGIQLYKEVVKNHSGYLINANCFVVEVGCGKGAGAEFLIKKFGPEKYIGIDYSEKAIDFCIKSYEQTENVNFICADAHKLPIIENSVDVVVSVESTHIYKEQNKFFNEVHRILKNNGNFLFTDYRYVNHFSIETLEKEIADCGFLLMEKRIITPNIYTACLLASDRRKEIIEEASPWYLKKYFYHYAILNGTKKSKKLGNGEIIYFLYHLKKNNSYNSKDLMTHDLKSM